MVYSELRRRPLSRRARRGNRAWLVAGFIGLILGLLLSRLFMNFAQAAEAKPAETVLVQAGDSLWSIAVEHGSGRDPLTYIYELKKVNGLTRSDLQVGQILTLPD